MTEEKCCGNCFHSAFILDHMQYQCGFDFSYHDADYSCPDVDEIWKPRLK